MPRNDTRVAVLAMAIVLLAGIAVATDPPLLTAPSKGAVIDPATTELAWSPVDGARGYEVRLAELPFAITPAQVLADPDTVVVATIDTSLGPLAAIDVRLTPGHGYAWQVVALTKDGPLSSSAGYFSVVLPQQRVTREDAVSTVVDRLIVPAVRERPAVAFLGRTMLPPGAQVEPFGAPEEQLRLHGYTWFAWIDDDPQAFFAHDGRFVLIDAVSGDVLIEPVEWWPVVDGESIWMDDGSWRDMELIVYSELHAGWEVTP